MNIFSMPVMSMIAGVVLIVSDRERNNDTCVPRAKKRKVVRDPDEVLRSLTVRFSGDLPQTSFRAKYRISKALFKDIRSKLNDLRPDFWCQRECAFKYKGPHLDTKILFCLQVLAGAKVPAIDFHFGLGKTNAYKIFKQFCNDIVVLFKEQLALPSAEKVKKLMQMSKIKHQLPGCIGSIDCMTLEWDKCPVQYAGACTGRHKRPTLVLEACCDSNLVFWHGYFGCPGSNNDLQVYYSSPLNEAIASGRLPSVDYELGGHKRKVPYLLADGIYPNQGVFAKSMRVNGLVNHLTENQMRWNTKQESARKDIERAFGILKKRFIILKSPVEYHSVAEITNIVLCCMLLHNLCVQYNNNTVEPEFNVEAEFEAENEIPPTYNHEEFMNFLNNSATEYTREGLANFSKAKFKELHLALIDHMAMVHENQESN